MNKTLKQYQTPQLLTNIKSNRNEPPTSEKRNTTQPNDTQQILTQEQKNRFRKFKENHEWKKDYLTITKKHRMENSQDGNKSSTNIYINR